MFLIESNQAYGSMVSYFFRQSDCQKESSAPHLVQPVLVLWIGTWWSLVTQASPMVEDVVLLVRLQ